MACFVRWIKPVILASVFKEAFLVYGVDLWAGELTVVQWVSADYVATWALECVSSAVHESNSQWLLGLRETKPPNGQIRTS